MIIFLNIFILFCIFIIGALFGSFFSLATYRIPRHEDIIATRSYCPNCKHKLSFFDLFPVISYITHLGKCKYCKDKISPRYILLESLNGLFFVFVYIVVLYLTNDYLKTLVFSMIFYIIYAVLFVIIGANIMGNKMKNENVKNKKGVYVAELVIAFIIFLILISSSVVISRNYSYNLHVLSAKSDLVNETQYQIETLKEHYYINGYSTTNDYVKDYQKNGYDYHLDVKFENYKDKNNTKYDLIKIINVTLSCNINGQNIEYSLSDYILNYNLLFKE